MMLRTYNPKKQAARRESDAMRKADERTARRRSLVSGPGRHASMGPAALAPAPKSPRAENPHLLAMARGRPCLIRSPICVGGTETTVACHGGGVANGKGMGYKVSDALTAWGCYRCNHYTDAYTAADAVDKVAAFVLGHYRQVHEWRRIATDPSEPVKDRAAALWALEQLNASPVVEI